MFKTEKKLDLQFHYKILLLCYLVFVPLIMLPNEEGFNLVLSKFVFLAVLTGYYIICVLPRMKIKFPVQAEDRWLLAYFICLLLSTAFAKDIALAVFGPDNRRDGLVSFVFYLVAYLVGKNVLFSKKILWGILASSFAIGLYGIIQFYQLDPISLGLFLPPEWLGRAFGTMGNPNFLGSYLVLVLPISLYVTITDKSILGLICFAVNLFALFCSRTRSAWIGAVAGLLVFFFIFFKAYKGNRLKSLGLLLLVLGIVIACISLFDSWNDGLISSRVGLAIEDFKSIIGHRERAQFAGSNRLYIWERVTELIKGRPLLGYGLENLGPVMESRYRSLIESDFGHFINFDKAHNEYLHIAVTSGIPALVFYLGFVISVIRKGIKKYKSGCKIMLVFLASTIGYLVQAFFNIQTILVYYIFMVMLGLLSSNFSCPDQAVFDKNLKDEAHQDKA